MRTRVLPTVAAVVATLTLAACGSGSSTNAATSSTGTSYGGADQIPVVASTDVWGDVVSQIGGDRVSVVSIITDPDADPHSYEANAQAQLAISKAAILVENGGGYDDFVNTMMSAANSKAQVINAVELSGKAASGGAELNEHVWYDFPTVATLADKLTETLSAIQPASAAVFRTNADAFKAELATLESQEAAIKTAHQGTGVAITEPVPVYLLDAAGLEDLTPPEFSTAIEEGTDASPSVLADTLALFTDKKVSALVYNAQTFDAQTEQLLAAAKTNDIPVVPVTETLPAGEKYIGWMTANVKAVAAALG